MHIRVGRIIAYAIMVAFTVFMYGYFRAFFFLLLFVMEMVMAAADIAAVVFLRDRVSFDIDVPSVTAGKDDPVPVIFKITNFSILPSFELSASVTTTNSFYGTSGTTQIALPLRARGETLRSFPVTFTLLGNYEFDVDSISVRDILGFVDLGKSVGVSAPVSVFPKRGLTSGYSADYAEAGMTEADETDRRGHDFSDVSEIREYVPGDRPRDIHWKLSAKRDELMVKERQAMSDTQLVIVIEFAEVYADNDRVIEEAYSLAEDVVRSGVNARLMWWSSADDDFRVKRLSEVDDVDAAFIEMFGNRAAAADVEALMRSVHPEIRAYLRVYFDGSQVQETVVDEA